MLELFFNLISSFFNINEHIDEENRDEENENFQNDFNELLYYLLILGSGDDNKF